MKYFFLLGLIVVLGISACGCVQSSTLQSTDVTPSPTVAVDESTSTNSQILATLTNKEPNTSLTLDPGVILVSFQANDPQTMTFNQECNQSWADSSEIRITSPYNGNLAFGIPTKDECTINISGSGTWTAEVTRYDMINPEKIPVNLSGSGTTVSTPFTLEKGEYIFQRAEIETASPAYELMFSNGSPLMDTNNTYVQPRFDRFSPDTFRIIDIPESGTYFLSVIAEENPLPWNASIIVMPAVPVMGPGPAIQE